MRGSSIKDRGSRFLLDASVRRKAARLVPALLDWFAREARDLPWRRTSDPYAIWVSEIMLQQTQVLTVIPYYQRWMKNLPHVRALARASSQRLHKLWEGLGYYTRVRNMQSAAKLVCKQHQGRFPDRFEDVLALPGIGRYTAGAICSIAFNQSTPILDGNVIRVLTRVFGIAGDPKQPDTNARLWHLAETLVREAAPIPRHSTLDNGQSALRTPQSTAAPCSALNQSLMELGATICAPRNPQCPACPIRRFCVARREGRTHALPELQKRPRVTRKHVFVFAIRNQNRLWVVRQPSNNGQSGLWQFPSIEVQGWQTPPTRAAKRILPFGFTKPVALTSFKHSITRYNITFTAFTGQTRDVGHDLKPGGGEWATLARLRSLPLPAAHRRIADLICDGSKFSATLGPADV